MKDPWLYILMAIFGGVFLGIGLLAWYAATTEPQRRVAWIAECRQHEMTAEQCLFLYRLDSRRRADEAADTAIMISNLNQQIFRSK